MAAGPALGVAVLGVVGIGNDVEEVGVAADAADILGRSGTGAVDAAGGTRRRDEGEQPEQGSEVGLSVDPESVLVFPAEAALDHEKNVMPARAEKS